MVKEFTDPWANTNALDTVMLLSFLLDLPHFFFPGSSNFVKDHQNAMDAK